MNRLPAGLAVLACALAWGGDLHADLQKKVSTEGIVHTVATETLKLPRKKSATAIRHTLQRPDGMKENSYIPGTSDIALDAEPALDLDPSSGAPVVVWIRNEGQGFDLFVSKLLDTGWTQPRRLFPTSAQESAPRIQFGGDWIHLTWSSESVAGLRFFRAVLDPGTLEVVHGPELLPTDLPDVVPPEGEAQPGQSPEPPVDYVYAAGHVMPSNPGKPGVVPVWGSRDEPMPIDYLVGFELPGGLAGPQGLQVRWLVGRLTVSFHDGEFFYYTMRKDGRWTDLRRVALDEETSPAQAMLDVEEMIRKDSPTSSR